MTTHCNTIQFPRTSTEAGREPRHAEAIARARARDELVTNELATKTGFTILKAGLNADVATWWSEAKQEIGTLGAEMKGEFGAVRAAFKSEFGAVCSDIKTETQSLRAELRADVLSELQRLKSAASIAMGLLSLIVVLTRSIR